MPQTPLPVPPAAPRRARRSFAAAAILLGVNLALSASASAERFCYYWVDDSGRAETYEIPPIDVAAPPFPDTRSQNGHLVVALTKDSCRRSVFLSEIDPGAVTDEREAISTPGAEIAPGVAPAQQ